MVSLVVNRATLVLSKTTSVCVFSGSDGCLPDPRFSWKPSPKIDGTPRVIVSKIHRKPSYGLEFMVVWSWRKTLAFLSNQNGQKVLRALVFQRTSARDQCKNGQKVLRALVCQNTSARESVQNGPLSHFGGRLPKYAAYFGRRLPKCVTAWFLDFRSAISAEDCRNLVQISAVFCRNCAVTETSLYVQF